MSFSKSSPDSADVVYVVEGGPAAQAGLRKGDTLIEVAGKSVKILSRRDLLHIFTQPPGTSVPITYNREGHRGLTTLVLRELLP
jgi:C-terminal processing protease CtpA/Prc